MPTLPPRYPVYVPSKGRASPGAAVSIKALSRGGVPFRLVVEEPEADAYRKIAGPHAEVLVLPFRDRGLLAARNWIRDHAEAEGHARHWQIDDNVRRYYRFFRQSRVDCPPGVALRVCEDFTDRYENVAVSGLNYSMFVTTGQPKPFVTNAHVYSISLINHACPLRWRLRYNDDTDLCLQVLAAGWTTVLLNAFVAEKLKTMTKSGGNTDDLYRGDGRIRMARDLERVWPGVVKVTRRYGRPAHVVDWGRFDTPLRLRPGVDLSALPAVDEYGMELTGESETPEHPRVRRVLGRA